MYQELIQLLNSNKEEHEKEFHEYSIEEKKMRTVFNALANRYGKLDENKINNMFLNDRLNELLHECVGEDNEILLEEQKEINEMVEKATERLKKLGDLRQRYKEKSSLMVIEKATEEFQFVTTKYYGFLKHLCEYFFEVYYKVRDVKENEKKAIKTCDSLIKQINSNKEISPKDLAYLTTLIDDADDVQKETLSSQLDNYLFELKKKQEKQKAVKTEEKPKLDIPSVFVDDEVDEIVEEDDLEYLNYYTAIKSFDNFNDIKIFLNSIKHSKNINKLLVKIIELLDNDDYELRDFLVNYLSDINSKEENETLVSSQKPVVLYYGFLRNKNVVFDDLTKEDISEESYKNVLVALERLKKDGAKNKTAAIIKERKIIKTRYKNIRLYFRRLSSNVYIVLGVFCKKDNKGNNIITTCIRRNNRLSLVENDIIENINNPEIWDKYILANDKLEAEILSVLKSKIK